MHRRFGILLAIALGLVPVGRARAEAPTRLDLPEAMRRAERSSPALGPPRAAVRGARGVADAADSIITHPPRVELGLGPRWRNQNRETGLEANLGVWQDLSLGGYGDARRRYAATLGKEAGARLEVGKKDVRAQAALAWVEARLARERVRIRKESPEHAEAIAKVAAIRVRTGSVSPAEESVANAQVGNARAELIAARGRAFVADAELRYLTGLAPQTPLEVVGALDARDAPLDRSSLGAKARELQPDVRAAEASAERALRAAEMVWAGGRPFIAVGPSVTREGTGDVILLGRVSVPLPLVNPASVESARARADAAVAGAEVRYLRSRLERDLTLSLEEREHARELRDALKSGVLGPAREALRQSMAQYEAGSSDIANVFAARRELLAAEERWAEAAGDVRRADIRLARLLGREPWQLGSGSP